MTEDLLIFLWKNKLYSPDSLVLPDGTKFEVVNPGEHNRDAGPDFFNTRIKIDNTIWAGNAEVHVRASDWIKHDHNSNESFQNVILHIVAENDAEIKDAKGEVLPAIALKCSDAILAQYNYLLQNQQWIPCAKYINQIDSFAISIWVEKMGIAKLEEKTKSINLHLDQTKNDWEEVLYRIMMRSFGFQLNGQPFEQLAKSLPLKILEKHHQSLINTEALLFGQAGFLIELIPYDDYFQKLQKEYRYLAQKYNLKPIARHLWKFLRLRPGNFPTIRIAQMAALIHKNPRLFASIREISSISELKELLEVIPSNYWNNHYNFGKVSKEKEKAIGENSLELIVINAVIPVLFMYGKKTGLEQCQNKALDFFEEIDPEKNSIIEKWNKLGIKTHNAFHSQALIYLKNNYCNKRLCLECNIGNKILSASA